MVQSPFSIKAERCADDSLRREKACCLSVIHETSPGDTGERLEVCTAILAVSNFSAQGREAQFVRKALIR